MQQLDAAQATASQKQSCTSQGGAWTGSETLGQCAPNTIPLAYNKWGAFPDLGIPLVGSIAATRSLGGALGGATGSLAMFYLGLGL
jgi:hypothetical protein